MRRHEGFRNSSLARLTAWSSGARRREHSKPKLFARLGNSFGLITAHSASADQLPFRSWWPANEPACIELKPNGYWDSLDFGLSIYNWTASHDWAPPAYSLENPPRARGAHFQLWCTPFRAASLVHSHSHLQLWCTAIRAQEAGRRRLLRTTEPPGEEKWRLRGVEVPGLRSPVER